MDNQRANLLTLHTVMAVDESIRNWKDTTIYLLWDAEEQFYTVPEHQLEAFLKEKPYLITVCSVLNGSYEIKLH